MRYCFDQKFRLARDALSTVHHEQPAEEGWLAERICCMVLAVEIRRMIQDQAPAFAGVRDLIRQSPES